MHRSRMSAMVMAATIAGSASAMPAPPTLTGLLDICTASTVSEATARGDALGWKRMTAKDTDEWRQSFLRYNGGSVEVTGWRRGDNEGDGLLSFWIATGPNAHKACTYSIADTPGLLEALTQQFGTPGTLDKYDFGTTAFWKKGAQEVAFSQTGSSNLITISEKP